MRPVALLLLALLVVAPLAGAQGTMTLSSFQEPRAASNQVYDFLVVGSEAYNYSGLLYLNAIGQQFRVTIFAPNGTAVYNGSFSRHIDTLPKLAPGSYRLVVQGAGTFAITRHYLDSLPAVPNVTIQDVDRTLPGGVESWILLPSQAWYVHVAGNVSVEWEDFLAADPHRDAAQLTTPVNRTALPGKLDLLVVRGQPGTPYSIRLEPAPLPAAATPTPAARTPGFGPAASACAALIAMTLRRLGGRRP